MFPRYGSAGMTILALIIAASNIGCTKRPSKEEMTKLEQTISAAEAAERKLAELRAERMALEQELEAKKRELGEKKTLEQDSKK